jgi:hypothetical protein
MKYKQCCTAPAANQPKKSLSTEHAQKVDEKSIAKRFEFQIQAHPLHFPVKHVLPPE